MTDILYGNAPALENKGIDCSPLKYTKKLQKGISLMLTKTNPLPSFRITLNEPTKKCEGNKKNSVKVPEESISSIKVEPSIKVKNMGEKAVTVSCKTTKRKLNSSSSLNGSDSELIPSVTPAPLQFDQNIKKPKYSPDNRDKSILEEIQLEKNGRRAEENKTTEITAAQKPKKTARKTMRKNPAVSSTSVNLGCPDQWLTKEEEDMVRKYKAQCIKLSVKRCLSSGGVGEILDNSNNTETNMEKRQEKPSSKPRESPQKPVKNVSNQKVESRKSDGTQAKVERQIVPDRADPQQASPNTDISPETLKSNRTPEKSQGQSSAFMEPQDTNKISASAAVPRSPVEEQARWSQSLAKYESKQTTEQDLKTKMKSPLTPLEDSLRRMKTTENSTTFSAQQTSDVADCKQVSSANSEPHKSNSSPQKRSGELPIPPPSMPNTSSEPSNVINQDLQAFIDSDPCYIPNSINSAVGVYNFPCQTKIASIFKNGQLYCALHEVIINLKLKIPKLRVISGSPDDVQAIRGVKRQQIKNNFNLKLIPLQDVYNEYVAHRGAANDINPRSVSPTKKTVNPVNKVTTQNSTIKSQFKSVPPIQMPNNSATSNSSDSENNSPSRGIVLPPAAINQFKNRMAESFQKRQPTTSKLADDAVSTASTASPKSREKSSQINSLNKSATKDTLQKPTSINKRSSQTPVVESERIPLDTALEQLNLLIERNIDTRGTVAATTRNNTDKSVREQTEQNDNQQTCQLVTQTAELVEVRKTAIENKPSQLMKQSKTAGAKRKIEGKPTETVNTQNTSKSRKNSEIKLSTVTNDTRNLVADLPELEYEQPPSVHIEGPIFEAPPSVAPPSVATQIVESMTPVANRPTLLQVVTNRIDEEFNKEKPADTPKLTDYPEMVAKLNEPTNMPVSTPLNTGGPSEEGKILGSSNAITEPNSPAGPINLSVQDNQEKSAVSKSGFTGMSMNMFVQPSTSAPTLSSASKSGQSSSTIPTAANITAATSESKNPKSSTPTTASSTATTTAASVVSEGAPVTTAAPAQNDAIVNVLSVKNATPSQDETLSAIKLLSSLASRPMSDDYGKYAGNHQQLIQSMEDEKITSVILDIYHEKTLEQVLATYKGCLHLNQGKYSGISPFVITCNVCKRAFGPLDFMSHREPNDPPPKVGTSIWEHSIQFLEPIGLPDVELRNMKRFWNLFCDWFTLTVNRMSADYKQAELTQVQTANNSSTTTSRRCSSVGHRAPFDFIPPSPCPREIDSDKPALESRRTPPETRRTPPETRITASNPSVTIASGMSDMSGVSNMSVMSINASITASQTLQHASHPKPTHSSRSGLRQRLSGGMCHSPPTFHQMQMSAQQGTYPIPLPPVYRHNQYTNAVPILTNSAPNPPFQHLVRPLRGPTNPPPPSISPQSPNTGSTTGKVLRDQSVHKSSNFHEVLSSQRAGIAWVEHEFSMLKSENSVLRDELEAEKRRRALDVEALVRENEQLKQVLTARSQPWFPVPHC